MNSHNNVPAATPLAALQAGVRQRQYSAAAQLTWRCLKRFGIALVLLIAAAWVPGLVGNILGAIAGTAATVFLYRLMNQDSAPRRFWFWFFAACALLILIPFTSTGGRVLFTIGAIFFLVFRRYGFFEDLGSRRRALLFLLAFVAFVLLVLSPDTESSDAGFTKVIRNWHGSAQFAVACFALVSLFRLFVGIRLHFMRLRPKLAVAGAFVAAVPILLLLTLSLSAIYGLIGGNRSTHGLDVMEDWLTLIAEDSLVGPGPFGAGFGEAMLAPGEVAAPPAFLTRLESAIEHAPFDPMPAAIWLRGERELWALRIVPEGSGYRLAGGRRASFKTIQRLADILGSEVHLRGAESGDLRIDSRGITTTGEVDGLAVDLRARPEGLSMADDPELSFFEDWQYFGASKMEVYDFDEGGLSKDDLLLSLKIRPVDIVRQFVSDRNEINQVLAYSFLGIVFIFLAFELFALYFGLRIVGGITVAVRTLHRTTERLARGDLDAWIELPNEDEFGDLADSFNEMTTAIRLAQDQIVQKELLEQQMAMARGIQERLLPSEMPKIEGYQVSGSSDPTLQVGGDYFDFVELGDGRIGIAVADVTGKGVPASLLMANVQAGLHGQAMHPGTAAEVIGRMNELLYDSTDSHMFVTFAYIILDPRTGEVESVSAGHEPTLLVRANGEVEKLGAGGLMLGMLPGQNYSEIKATLEVGDVLVIYTDGITEAMGPSLVAPLAIEGDVGKSIDAVDEEDEDDDDVEVPFFEEHRLVDVCVARRGESAEDIRRAILAAVKNFTSGVPQSDDITLVVVKREAKAA